MIDVESQFLEAVLGALASALPERVAAAATHFANPTIGGSDPARGRRFVAYELVLSGTGARATRDGCEGMSWAFNASRSARVRRDPDAVCSA